MHETLSLNAFTAIDETGQAAAYIAALEAFDGIDQLQELKRLEREMVRPGSAILDVGCGFGLETVPLARRAGKGGTVCGIDRSEAFIAEARRRATAQGLPIDYRVGDAAGLPYADHSFDHVRAERLLIYFDDVERVLAGMRRVLRPDGVMALIEPEFCTTTVNVSNRALVRRVMAHEAETAVAQSWLPGRLAAMLRDLGFADIALSSRVVVFPQQLAADYFLGAAAKAAKVGVLSEGELAAWTAEIRGLLEGGRLFASEGYFLFTGRQGPLRSTRAGASA